MKRLLLMMGLLVLLLLFSSLAKAEYVEPYIDPVSLAILDGRDEWLEKNSDKYKCNDGMNMFYVPECRDSIQTVDELLPVRGDDLWMASHYKSYSNEEAKAEIEKLKGLLGRSRFNPHKRERGELTQQDIRAEISWLSNNILGRPHYVY